MYVPYEIWDFHNSEGWDNGLHGGQNVVRQVVYTFLEKYTAYIPDDITFLQNFSNHPSYEIVL